MKKYIVLIMVLLLAMVSFSAKSDIFAKHNDGFFLGSSTTGIAIGNFEIITDPIQDIVNNYNINLRYFINENTLINAYIDSNGNIKSYYHGNLFFMNNLVLRTHAEITDNGNIMKSNMNGIRITGGRLYEKLGFFPFDDNFEIFAGIDTGMVFLLNADTSKLDPFSKIFYDELNKDKIYSFAKFGIKLYDDYYNMEIGYRYQIKESPAKIISSEHWVDYFYNYYTVYRKYFKSNAPSNWLGDLNIPFITTDYYLIFTTYF